MKSTVKFDVILICINFGPLDIYSDPAVYQLYVARVIGLDNLNPSYALPVDETHTIEIPHEVTGLKVELFSIRLTRAVNPLRI